MEIPKLCNYCGKEFMAKRTSTRYCSPSCNSAHYKILSRKRVIKRATSFHINKIFPTNEQINKKIFLSINEACTLLGLSRSTLNRYIKNGKIEIFKLNKKVIIKRESIDSFLMNFQSIHIPDEVLTTKNSFNIKDYYYFGEIQNLYGVSESTIYNHLRTHKIEKVKIGKYYYILKTDVTRIFGEPNKKTETDD